MASLDEIQYDVCQFRSEIDQLAARSEHERKIQDLESELEE